ncbi:hypothetical protein [Vibrio parahaemolyticus]|uniref:hypothetical protein n=1 Tax=Vibrio parahaemolyticus TaxID=670 RepID=UPI00235A2E75|nr:hypothetical protein [Vibrio parahaemolyticus]WCZ04254.1 hypothetical protein GSS61_24560 [Vibrio parahaemolyticus]
MSIIGIVFAIIIALVVIRVFSFLSPFIFFAFVIAYAKNSGWSNIEIASASVAIFVIGCLGYAWIKQKVQERQSARFYEFAESERKRLDEIYNNHQN